MASPPIVDRIDHLVLTVRDIEATTRFYARALGLERECYRGPQGQPRHALRFGNQKINLQDTATDTPTKARRRAERRPPGGARRRRRNR